MDLRKTDFAYVVRLKFDFGKLSTLLIDSFLIELTFLSQMNAFSRNMSHHSTCIVENKNL